MKREHNKKSSRVVSWECDKKDCSTINERVVPKTFVLNDDVCDYCHRSIHEPILKYEDDKH
jgi:aspartate carbamoyltransferase regulatory subunit